MVSMQFGRPIGQLPFYTVKSMDLGQSNILLKMIIIGGISYLSEICYLLCLFGEFIYIL